ncbi:MAG TPA: PQQ-binding-like beta-propeller repeat protein [Solirubrobacteraceae bacterium]
MRSGGGQRGPFPKLVAARHALLALAAGVSLGIAIVACGGHAARANTTSRQVSAAPASVPGGDWLEFDYDPQRGGVAPSSGISSRDLRSLRTRVVGISGIADSSAVELHGIDVQGRVRDVIFITTTYGKTIAIDPASGAILWQFVPADIGSYLGSSQITTATPLIDPSRAQLYAASPDGRVHKLAVATGAEVRSGHWPVRVTFDPTHEKLPAAFNISGSSLVVTTGGYYGDTPPYQGHVVLIDRSSGAITHVWNSLCSDRHHLIDPPSSCHASDAAIWGRSGAVIEPGSGRILVATGNAPFNGSTDWGNSVLELSPDAAALLHNWTPRDQAQLNSSDTDLGSTAPALLPPVRGYRLAVQGGKDGLLHLLNLNRLDGTTGGASGRLGGALQSVGSPGGGEVLTAPAVWPHAGRVYVFVADDSGTAAYTLRLGRHPRLVQVWQNGNSGTSPLVAGNLLYVYDDQSGRLDIYGPARGGLLRSLPAAPGHWSSPIVIGGRIILPTGGSTANNAAHSRIFIYHLPGQ